MCTCTGTALNHSHIPITGSQGEEPRTSLFTSPPQGLGQFCLSNGHRACCRTAAWLYNSLCKLIQNFLPMESCTLGITLLMALSLLPVSPHARANHWPNVLIPTKEPVGFVLFHLHISATTWLSQKIISCWHFSVSLFSISPPAWWHLRIFVPAPR